MPERSLKIHLVWSVGETAHSVATPGITTLALSADERSQVVRPSYIVLPVKRLPSNPWSGWPTVFGMSAAVMPMRTVCADAVPMNAASSSGAVDRLNKAGFFIAISPLDAITFQGLCQRGGPQFPAATAARRPFRRAPGHS